MASNSQPSGSSPPPKPWERAGSSSGPAPFKPPSAGSTSDVVEASGTAKPGEIVSTSNINTAVNTNTLARPVPTRPWEQNYGTSGYGGYGSTMNNTGYGSSMYGGSYGGVGGVGGGLYGGGMYGNSMYNRGGYGGLYGSSGMYGGGGGMYNSGLGGPMGGYGGMGMGMGMGGPYGAEDPNNPYGPPSAPPGFWISALRVMQGVVNFFGRISILIDQNTQAVHFFMMALLQRSLSSDHDQSITKSPSLDNLRQVGAVDHNHDHDSGYHSDGVIHDKKRKAAHERKKGLPWTIEEHRSFLGGLNALGKGDWKGISKDYVRTRSFLMELFMIRNAKLLT